MRQQIDCAVITIASQRVWLDSALKQVEPAMARIRMHSLDWEAEQTNVIDASVNIDIQAFAKSAVSLRRFDVCLLPVSLETLSWTRQALAAIPRGPFVPLIGVFSGLRSAAMQDLLELGLADFVRLPLCPDEYRARILSTVSKVPRPGSSLREPGQIYGESTNGGNYIAHSGSLPGRINPSNGFKFQSKGLKLNNKNTKFLLGQKSLHSSSNQENISFRQLKAIIVEQFERDYVTRALEVHNGNIAKAARASNKHRRAFWALMRKYQIDASQYRPDDDEE